MPQPTAYRLNAQIMFQLAALLINNNAANLLTLLLLFCHITLQ